MSLQPNEHSMTPHIFEQALSRLLLLPVVALATLAFVLTLQIHSLESSNAWVDHSDRAIAQMNQLTQLTIDEETGVRGFLLTGRKEFLEPYDLAQRDIEAHFQELQQLVRDNPTQVERLHILLAQRNAWEKTAAARMQAQTTHEQLVAESLAAKASMDQIRSEAAQFIEAERSLRLQRASDALFRSRRAYFVLCVPRLPSSCSPRVTRCSQPPMACRQSSSVSNIPARLT